jgi:group I intron endonuclease
MEIIKKYHLFDDELPGSTGIYAIANIKNGKLYIGSASGVHPKYSSMGGFKHRFYGHRQQLREGNHHAVKLRRSFASKKSSPEDFEIWILEYCPPEKCIEREQWYFDTYKPWYNSSLVAGGNNSKRSFKTRKLLSDGNCKHSYIGVSPEGVVYRFVSANKFKKEFGLPYLSGITNTCKGVYNQYKGWYFCYEETFNLLNLTDQEFAAYAKNKINSVWEAGKTKRSESFRKRFKYIGISPDNNVYNFNNAREFGDSHNIDPSSITKCCKNKLQMTNRWIFFYEKDYCDNFDPTLYRHTHEINRIKQWNSAREKQKASKVKNVTLPKEVHPIAS